MTHEQQIKQQAAELSHGIPGDSGLGRYTAWLTAHVIPLLVRHDLEAQEYQRRHQFILKFIYVASAAVIGLVICQALFLPHHYYLIWGEVIALGGMLYLQRRDRLGRYHDRWMEARYLAERLRCSIFAWAVRDEAGIRRRAAVPRSFLADEERGKVWEAVLDQVDFADKPDIDPTGERETLRGFLATHWLEPQRAYHLRAAHRNHGTMSKLERMGQAFLIITIVAALMHALGLGHYTPLWRPWEIFAHPEVDPCHPPVFTIGNLLVVLAILLPAISSAANAIKGSMEYHKLALRSHQVADGIKRLQEDLEAAADGDALKAVVDHAEELFLAEHEEWFSLVTHKEVEVG